MWLKPYLFSATVLKYSFIILILFPITKIKAQTISEVSGIIIDSTTRKPLNKTTLIRLSDNKIFFTDSTGLFYITCLPNDAIRISYIGFKTERIVVSNVPDSAFGYKKFIRIPMIRDLKSIRQAVVISQGSPGKTDSVFYSEVLKPVNPTVSFNDGALTINAFSYLYKEFSKTEKEKKELTNILQQKYVDDVLKYRVSKQKLLNLTGDPKFTIELLKAHCSPTDFFILNASDFDLYTWVKSCYNNFKKETARER